ncbi:MAG: TPM domain-containing protein [Candidatus Omnitrophota bacterium]
MIAAVIFTTKAFALSVPEKPQSYVNDYIGLLSPEARGRIERTLAEYERQTSNQVVVAIFQSLEGGSLEDFSIRLAEKWKAGQKDKDNGIILLIFKDDRAVRIEVGYGLEGALPDAVADQIIYNEIVPAFRAGDFDRGVESAVGAIIQATKGEYKASTRLSEDRMKDYSPALFFAMVAYFLFPILCYAIVIGAAIAFLGFPAGLIAGLILVVILAVLRQVLMTAALGSTLSGRRHGHGGYGGGSGGWGGGGFGGGFSGGGGSFGGGGASGRW